jgi:hypothetical protein
VSQGAVFWFDAKDSAKAREWVETHTCFPRNNVNSERQHYFRHAQVAKLFASPQQKGDEGDPIFRALNQCLNGYINSLRRDSLLDNRANEVITFLDYPVLVCSDFRKFYRTDIAAAGNPIPVASDFLLELNYAYIDPGRGNTRSYFLVDVLDFGRLDNFVREIEAEVNAAQLLVQDN